MYTVIDCYLYLPNPTPYPNPTFAYVEHGIITIFFSLLGVDIESE